MAREERLLFISCGRGTRFPMAARAEVGWRSHGGITMRTRLISALAILALAPAAAWAVPDGPMPGRGGAPETSQDPKTIARTNYNQGYDAVQGVAKLELEAATMPAFASQY